MELIIDGLIGGLILGGLYALVALGLNLQFGVAKMLNLTHGDFIMFFALATYSFYIFFQVSPLLVLVLSGPLAFLFGFVLYKGLFQRLQIRSGSPAKLATSTLLASFGLSFIIQNVALLIWGGDIKRYVYLAEPINFMGFSYMLNMFVVFVVAVCLSIVIFLFLRKTMFGTAIRASSSDIVGAYAVGIDVRKTQTISFALGAGIAGMSGTLVSMMFAIEPMIGVPYTLMALIIIVVGGAGNFLGSLLAGFTVGAVEGVGGSLLGPGLRLVLIYALLVIILLLKPQGIFGGK